MYVVWMSLTKAEANINTAWWWASHHIPHHIVSCTLARLHRPPLAQPNAASSTNYQSLLWTRLDMQNSQSSNNNKLAAAPTTITLTSHQQPQSGTGGA